MAGPGGGGHGGGGGRSHGGFSGGSGGGGFHYTPPMGGYHMRGGWHFHPHHNGGCLSWIIFPIVFLFICAGSLLSPQTTTYNRSGSVAYNEEVYQDYVNDRYAEAFSSAAAYEDNLLISVLVDDDYYSYCYIAWVGDHIDSEINYMLGGSQTTLGQAMESCINQSSYKYSLDSNLAQVMEQLTQEIEALRLESAFRCDENHSGVKSVLINDSAMELTDSTVNSALAAFTDATGIPAVIVVEDMTDVFGSATSLSSIWIVAVAALVLIVAAVVIVKFLRKRGQDNPYNSFDDQY